MTTSFRRETETNHRCSRDATKTRISDGRSLGHFRCFAPSITSFHFSWVSFQTRSTAHTAHTAHRLVGKRRERFQDGRGGTQCIFFEFGLGGNAFGGVLACTSSVWTRGFYLFGLIPPKGAFKPPRRRADSLYSGLWEAFCHSSSELPNV